MARPKSEDKRLAIMRAATRVIVTHGLSAPTAMIAKAAGISNGSLFTYFETKTELYNQLYLELKKEMVAAAWREISLDADLRTQMSQVWSNWMEWATAHPDKRRAVALLGVSEDLSPATRQAVQKIMAPLAALMERVRALGSMRQVPMAFVGALVTSMAEATMDFMIQDPAQAKKHCQAGFEAFWRAIS